ncbi:MAG: Ser-Thr-rich GPI-anchored membrane family protein [Reichenbachiella sp.]|uniref:Ser-Thr-rich GPI-anchored membrane family protein n=1 Tax=Reichenbachiella sp. TaxID=2184521 RepID=UPI0032977406
MRNNSINRGRKGFVLWSIGLALLMVIIFSSNVWSQSVENASIVQLGDDLIISFDLMPKESVKELYTVTILAIADNDSIHLIPKKGYLTEVRPGNSLQFVVSGKENLKNVNGEVDFSISAEMVYSPLRILSPQQGVSIRRGKEMKLEWKGGFDKDNYTLDLIQSDSLISTINTNVGGGRYNWNIPKRTKKKENYQLRLTSNRHASQPEFSSEFRIKNKIPVVVKVLPVMILGGALTYWLTRPDESSTSSEVPDPPALPEL